jgi:hypothetical protein
MNTYEVTIRATVTKTLSVEAKDERCAEEAAHEQFSVLNDGVDENYDQETLRIEERES